VVEGGGEADERADVAEGGGESDGTVGKAGAGKGRGPDPDGAAGPLKFVASPGYTACTAGLSGEGAFDRELPLERVARWLAVLGPAELDVEGDEATTLEGDVTVFREGAVVVKGGSEDIIEERMALVRDLVFRAAECAGCRTCFSRCPEGALVMDEELSIASPDMSRCAHCGLCLGPCPVTGFRPDDEFQL
jgi:Pyruvate/2-oxoacid:ferredoxin oxidoreductase delta subunit